MIRHLVLFALSLLMCLISGCSGCQRDVAPKGESAPDYSGITVNRVLPTELTVGKGAEVAASSTVIVNYDGWIYDPAKPENRGFQFGSSHEGKFQIHLGKGEVIPGWEQGIVGMREGGKRRLIIPADLAYGAQGSGNIPPNSILMIEVEVIKVL